MEKEPKRMADRLLASGLDLGEELKKLHVTTRRMGVAEIADWAKLEAWGYAGSDKLPKHRRWRLNIVGTLYNPYQAIANEVPIPETAIAEEIREDVLTHECREGVGTICETLKGDTQTSGVFRTEHPNLTLLINSHRGEHGAVSEGWDCTHARAEFSRVRLVKVVEKAQEIAVDFCLECEERSIDIVHEHGGDNERWIKTLDAGALEAAKTIGREVVMRLLG